VHAVLLLHLLGDVADYSYRSRHYSQSVTVFPVEGPRARKVLSLLRLKATKATFNRKLKTYLFSVLSTLCAFFGNIKVT
jgi:hypothetical protein